MENVSNKKTYEECINFLGEMAFLGEQVAIDSEILEPLRKATELGKDWNIDVAEKAKKFQALAEEKRQTNSPEYVKSLAEYKNLVSSKAKEKLNKDSAVILLKVSELEILNKAKKNGVNTANFESDIMSNMNFNKEDIEALDDKSQKR